MDLNQTTASGQLKAVAPNSIDKAVQVAEMLELRRQGYSYAQIGDIVGMNYNGVAELIRAGLRSLASVDGEDVKMLELQRLDEMWKHQYARAIDRFSPAAVQACMQIMERRARLLGLDAPVKTQNEHSFAMLTDDDIDARLTELVSAAETGLVIDAPGEGPTQTGTQDTLLLPGHGTAAEGAVQETS